MHGRFEKPGRNDDHLREDGGLRFLIVPVVVGIGLLVLTMVHPKASIWISQAVQAEFGGFGVAEDVSKQPGMAIPVRTVRAQ